MNNFDPKPVIIFITVCALVGWGIQHFTGVYWLTATLLLMIVILINGLITYNEDLDKDGYGYQKDITDTPEAKTKQRTSNKIQIAIIILLIIAAAWSCI